MGVYSKSSTVNESAIDMSNITGEGHIMDAVIESVINDLNMFNAVITLDFAEAYTNLGMDVFMEGDEGEASDDGAEKASGNEKAQDAAKDGIVKKIGEGIHKVVTTLLNLAKNLANKFADLFKTNKKLYEKYATAFSNNAATKNVKTRTIGTNMKSKIEESYKRFSKVIDKFDDVDVNIDETNRENLFDIIKDIEGVDGDESSEKERTLTTAEISEIRYMMAKGADKPAIIKFITNLAKMLNNKEVALRKKKANVADANGAYKHTIAQATKIAAAESRIATAYNRHFAYCRKIFLQVARGQAEESKEESAAMDYCVGLASDIYMESVFAI